MSRGLGLSPCACPHSGRRVSSRSWDSKPSAEALFSLLLLSRLMKSHAWVRASPVAKPRSKVQTTQELLLLITEVVKYCGHFPLQRSPYIAVSVKWNTVCQWPRHCHTDVPSLSLHRGQNTVEKRPIPTTQPSGPDGNGPWRTPW